MRNIAGASLPIRIHILLGWDDVGDFSSLADLLPAESNQPRILGDNGLGMFISCLVTEGFALHFILQLFSIRPPVELLSPALVDWFHYLVSTISWLLICPIPCSSLRERVHRR